MLEAHEVLVLERQRALQEEEAGRIVGKGGGRGDDAMQKTLGPVTGVTGFAGFGRSWTWFCCGFWRL